MASAEAKKNVLFNLRRSRRTQPELLPALWGEEHEAEGTAGLFPDSLIWAIVTVFIVGLGATIGLIAVMKAHGFDDGMTSAFAGLSFLLMLMVESVFIWLLFSGRRGAHRNSEAARSESRATNELDAAPISALPEPASSVIEQTTRTFDPAYSERRAE